MALKVGTEDKKKVYLASGLGLVMLILLGRFLWQTFGPSPAPAAPPPTIVTAPRPATPSSGPEETSTALPYARQAVKVSGLASLDPTLHPEIMRQAESLAYTGNGRNIFSPFSAPPAIPKPIAPHPPARRQRGPTTATATAAHQPRLLWLRGGEDGAETGLPIARRRHLHRLRG